MKKIQWIAAAAAMVFVLFCMSACGSAGDETATEETAAEDTAATIELSEDRESISVARPGLDIKIATIIVASEMGFFDEENLDVSFEQVADLATGLTAVSKDEIDVIPFGVIPPCSFISQGTDVVIFGGTIAEGSEAVTLKENADKYKTAEDFKGAKIACFRMETGHMVMKGWLREQGLDVNKDVEWIYLDSMQSEVEAVEKGEADLCFVNSGYGFVAQQNDDVSVAFQVGDYVENFPCCRMTTSRNAMDTKVSALTKFMIGCLRGYEVIQNDHETAIKCLADYSGQDAAYVENVIYGTDDYDAAMIVDLDPSVNAVADFYETMKLNGDIDENTTYDIRDNLDSSIYTGALQILSEREPDNNLWTELMTTSETKDK